MSSPIVLRAWQALTRIPLGKRVFTRAICFKAPYFGSIRPRFVELGPGHCVATVPKHRAITNHLGTIHAIALCNLAELAGGIMTEASVPPTHRWIPKGMTVEYLKKAGTDVRARAYFDRMPDFGDEGFELPAQIEIADRAGDAVFRGTITMWISPRKRG